MDCLICHENILKTGYGVSIECGHIFHGKCLMEWKATNQTCPICRAVFSVETIHTLYLMGTTNDEDYKFEICSDIKEKDQSVYNIPNEVQVESGQNQPTSNVTSKSCSASCLGCGVMIFIFVILCFPVILLLFRAY